MDKTLLRWMGWQKPFLLKGIVHIHVLYVYIYSTYVNICWYMLIVVNICELIDVYICWYVLISWRTHHSWGTLAIYSKPTELGISGCVPKFALKLKTGSSHTNWSRLKSSIRLLSPSMASNINTVDSVDHKIGELGRPGPTCSTSARLSASLSSSTKVWH